MKRSLATLLALFVSYGAFVGAIFFSLKSNAMVQPIGTFVPAVCGDAFTAGAGKDVQPAETLIQVDSICAGSLAGQTSQMMFTAFEVRLNNGQTAVFQVADISNLMMKIFSGASRWQVSLVGPSGELAQLKLVRLSDGSIRNVSGAIGDLSFFVAQMNPVLTVQ